MSPRPRVDRCNSCGGTEFVQAVDNDGKAYFGCARCIVCLPGAAQLIRMTASVDSLVADFLVAHPRALPGDVSVLALLEWNADRLRAAGIEPSVPARLWQALGGPRAVIRTTPIAEPVVVDTPAAAAALYGPEMGAAVAEVFRNGGPVFFDAAAIGDDEPTIDELDASVGAVAEAFGAQRTANIARDPRAEMWAFQLTPAHAATIEAALAAVLEPRVQP